MRSKDSSRGKHGRAARRLLQGSAATLALVCTSAAYGQFRASIQGTVSDPTGAAIPNATVTLTDIETNRTIIATSNASGVYSFNALAPDHYRLSAKAAGFAPKDLDNITITPDQANAVNVELAVGDAGSTVTVTSNATPVLETATATISGTVDANQIQHLPSAGRDVFQLAQLAPGVFGDGSQAASGTQGSNLPGTVGPGSAQRANGIFQTENAPQANANGGQNGTNGISIDGISTVSAVWGGASIVTPSEDSVGSLKVISNGYDAENGRFSGAQIQVTSKTGSNQFHGSAYFRANRPGLNAYQRYNGPNTFNAGTALQRGLLRDTTRSNQIGGSVGGPILHDKLFFFFSYETQRDNSSRLDNGWYETAEFRALAPAGSIAATYLNFPGSPVSATSIVNRTCSDSGFVEGTNCRTVAGGLNLGSPLTTPRGTQDLSWQSNTNPGTGNGLNNVPTIAFYNTLNPTTQVGSQYNGRLDGDVTQKDHLAFAIYWVPLTRTNYTGPVRAYNLFHHNQINDAYSIIWNHVFSPSFLNEARANDAGYRWNELTDNPQEPFGLPQSTVDSLGSQNISIGSFGAPGPSNLNQHTYSYKDVATKTIGNHIIKFGGELTRLYYLNNPLYSARPNYNFYNIWAFLNDAPHAEFGTFNPSTGTPTTNRQDTRENLYGFFAQDDWKATPNLTLSMGVRYSYFGPLSSKQGNIGTVQFGTGGSTFTGLNVRRGGSQTQTQKGNVGPQFGFAYNPDLLNHKMVMRGGYGLNYNQTEIATAGNEASNFPYVLNASFNASTLQNRVANIDPRIAYGVATDPRSIFGFASNPNAVTAINAANLPVGGGASLTAYDAKQPTIYSQHYSLDMQFELPFQFVATVGYQGNVTRHLTLQSQAYVRSFLQGYAQNSLVQNISYFHNTGTANNNQFLLGIKKQMSHQFSFDAEFQWAKTMDQGSQPYYQDPYSFNPSLAYGRSDYNFGKALKVYGIWQPVFFKSNKLVSSIADGWSISGIYNIHTGFPFSATYNVPGGSLYFPTSGYGSLRPSSYNNAGGRNHSNNAFKQPATGGPNVNFPNAGANQTYFGIPASGIPAGNGAYTLPSLPGVARNSFDGPGYQDFDATVTKLFGLPSSRYFGERPGLEIRADAFNLFNLTNLAASSVQTNIESANFGQANAGLAGRIVNLQARFSF